MNLIGKLVAAIVTCGLTTSFIVGRVPGAIMNEGIFYTALIVWCVLSVVAVIVIGVNESSPNNCRGY